MRTVSEFEIEESERMLILGLDYMFRCYHTSSALQNLLPDFFAFQRNKNNAGETFGKEDHLIQKALDIARRVLIFSDAPFLFTPCHTAFAIASMVSGSITDEGKMGNDIQAFLVKAFPRKTKKELLSFTRIVHEIIQYLMTCPLTDLRSSNGQAQATVVTRAKELRRVLGQVAKIRRTCPPLSEQPLKRTRYNEPDLTPPRQQLHARKYAKVTPMAKRVRVRS